MASKSKDQEEKERLEFEEFRREDESRPAVEKPSQQDVASDIAASLKALVGEKREKQVHPPATNVGPPGGAFWVNGRLVNANGEPLD
jgi:hypothetical protein